MYIFFCLLTCLSCYSQDNNWYLKKNEQGVIIYSRKATNSEFRELKAEVEIKTSLNSIVALLTDWDSYPQWIYRCGQSYTLKKINASELIHYQTITIPWPAKNQDLVINIKITQDEKTKIVTIKSTCNANYIPPFPDHVRITAYDAAWILIPLKDGTTKVIHQLQVNSSGLVAWMVNIIAIDGTYETMLNFKEWVVKKKYQNEKTTFIKELND